MKHREVWLAALLLLLPNMVMAEDVIQIGSFNKDAAIVAAETKGFLQKENIRVQINTVTDSPTLLRNLISAKYDLILNKHGLELNKDYTFKAFGNTAARADAMSRGDASGAMMSLADDEIQKRGL